MNVLIIEDEIKAARKLSDLITEVDNSIHIIEVLGSVEESIKWFREHPSPDLIFSDIQLSDGLCFDIYKEATVSSPIIFCTAFDEYLIHAFETNAVSYLLKPITKEQVEKALEKYQSLKQAFQSDNKGQNKSISDIITYFSDVQKYKSSLIVNYGEKIIPLKTADIAFIHLQTHSTIITTHNKQQYFYSSSLDYLEGLLNPAIFFRANRQFIINRNAIANAEHYFNRKLIVKLLIPTPERIMISKLKASEFMLWLEQ